MPPITVPLSPANTTQIVPNQNPTDRQSFWQTAVDRLLKSPTWDWPVIKQGGVPVATVTSTLINLGTPGAGTTVTPNPSNGFKQQVTNNAAFTIAATGQVGDVELLIVNGAAAGAVTFTGFDKQFVGDALDTVSGHQFVVLIYGFGTKKAYLIKALQ
jgi:hypothetical protein